MDLAHRTGPRWRSDRVPRRQRRSRRTGLDQTSSAPARGPVVASVRDWSEHEPVRRVAPVTVEELSQIPGAREALANYIGILQEWATRAEKDGAAP